MTRRQRIGVSVVSLALAVGLGYAIRARAGGIPATGALSYAGVLEGSSGPLTGSHNIQVSLYNAASAGTLLCQAASAPVTVTDGYFSVPLPDACTTAVGANANTWVDVVVDGNDTGTTKVGAVPYAVEANHAVNADNAANATGTLSSTISGIQANVTTLQGDVGTIDTNLVARVAGANASLPTMVGGGLNGSKTQMLFQGGSNVGTVDSSGDMPVTFPVAFPNGLVSVVAIPGSNPAQAYQVSVYSASGFTVHSPIQTSGQARVNYIAIGW